MTRRILVTAMMAAMTLAAQDKMTDALRKGIAEEEAKQNLAGAIQNYESVMTQFADARKTAATALFRLAECYQKQGNKARAMSSYQRLIKDFSDQRELSARSSAELVRTYGMAPAAAGLVKVEGRGAAPQVQKKLPAEKPRTADEDAGRDSAILLEIEKFQADLENATSDLAKARATYAPQHPKIQEAQDTVMGIRQRISQLEQERLVPIRAARSEYRKTLEAEVEVAQKQLTAMQQRYNGGAAPIMDVNAAQLQLIRAQRALAAFDAGIAEQGAK